ncbi:response regulator transcription factor [Membranihabitans maritimus]|uniref:response regulator transcription factor n=1 Tax=Membranihabitans maritimus TaxID=2904244 RepID=UPI001F48DE5B|nr:response regulator transcription factor [Membranihabitans maritimus]
MVEKAKILLVEDDITLGFVTRDNLELNNYEILYADTGEKALQIFREKEIDLVILDIMLPDINGFDIAEKIRFQDKNLPIIFLSAKSLVEDRIKGLRLGADDYIVKPFSIEELILRINVFLKRKYGSGIQDSSIRISSYIFDYRNLILQNGEFNQNLTQKEADVLKILTENQNNICKRHEILIAVWGEDDYFLGRSLDVFISRLRKYLRKDPNISIENIHSVGFKLKVMT